MAGFRYRLIDTAGSELAIVPYAVPRVKAGETVHLPDGRGATVLEVYEDEEHGREGDIQATLVVEPKIDPRGIAAISLAVASVATGVTTITLATERTLPFWKDRPFAILPGLLAGLALLQRRLSAGRLVAACVVGLAVGFATYLGTVLFGSVT
jgi:hypothetical protein